MTKKDYELIAKVLTRYSKQKNECCFHNWAHIIIGLADEFQKTNPRFNRDIFIHACQE
jgi:hypothetical protein